MEVLHGHVSRSECRQGYNIKIDDSFFDRVEEFRYIGINLTNQNSIQKDIKGRLKSGNACYHSVQNLLSSSLLPKNVKTKIYKSYSPTDALFITL
jgi:hypothetical protein